MDFALVFLGTQRYNTNDQKKPVFPDYVPFL